MKNRFGILLAELREKHGYKSQRQLALAVGISPATVSRLESGQQKSEPETIAKIAKVIGHFDNLMIAAGYIEKPETTDEAIEENRILIKDDRLPDGQVWGKLKEEAAKYGYTPEQLEEAIVKYLHAIAISDEIRQKGENMSQDSDKKPSSP